ncbi:MAG TPA: PQQ-binding-like beta-propeller repeat protein [Thermoanaerobaculia bacterium]
MGDVVYIGACSGVFSAIDRSTGAPIWLYDIAADGKQSEFHSTPVVTKDRIFVGTDGAIGHIYAFDLRSGDVAWKYLHKGNGNGGFTSDVLLDDDRIIGVTVDERVVALNAGSGAEVWSFPIGSDKRRVGMSAALTEDRVFFGSAGGAVYAIDARRGTQIWKRQLDSPTSTAIAVSGDSIIVGTKPKQLHRLRMSDGRVLATLDLSDAPDDEATPVVNKRGIYVVGEKEVMLIDPNLRRIVWHAESKNRWTSPRPRLWRGWVVVGDRQGTVYALDEATGTVAWSQSVHNKAIRGIGSDESTLYIGTIDGKVMALQYAIPSSSSPK